MAKAGRKPQVDQEKFMLIKGLLARGVYGKEVARLMNLSPATISLLRNAKSLEDYKAKECERNKRNYAKKKQKTPAESSVPTPVAQPAPSTRPVVIAPATRDGVSDYQMRRLIELVSEQNELLKLVSNKLAFIVESLA